jgi:hypothetical protein
MISASSIWLTLPAGAAIHGTSCIIRQEVGYDNAIQEKTDLGKRGIGWTRTNGQAADGADAIGE